MKKMITGVLLNAKEKTAEAVTVEASLDSYYDILDCRCITIAGRWLGTYTRRHYLIVADDEGLLTNNPILSAISSKGEPMLVGNLFIVKEDESDPSELASLDADDIEYVKSKCDLMYCIDRKREIMKELMLLTACNYFEEDEITGQ